MALRHLLFPVLLEVRKGIDNAIADSDLVLVPFLHYDGECADTMGNCELWPYVLRYSTHTTF